MQTTSRNSIVEAITLYVADKPFLFNQFEKFAPSKDVEDDLGVYAAFSGSIHEIPSRIRSARR